MGRDMQEVVLEMMLADMKGDGMELRAGTL